MLIFDTLAIWGNFVIYNDPSINACITDGTTTNSKTVTCTAYQWPVYSKLFPNMINLNQTGGVLANVTSIFGYGVLLEYVEPGLRNDIELVDAYSFDYNRGTRCEFWRSVSRDIPE